MIFNLMAQSAAYIYVVQQPNQFQYGVGYVLPLISLMMVFLAYNAIRRDEKLVRSLDRIR